MAAPPYGPPPVGFPVPQSPAGRSSSALIATVILAVVLLVAASGAVGSYFLLRSPKTTASGPMTATPLSPTADDSPSPSASAAPIETEEPVQQGPQASAYPAEEIDDLTRVCDENVYYPELPKRAGKAPHPLALFIGDGSGLRYQDGTYYFSQGLSKTVEQSWAPSDPRKVQMVACLDRVSVGAKIRSCKYDDPKPETLTLLRANWRLRVYEAATGRKLLDKRMAGDDQTCPYVVLVRADKKIYAEVSDRAKVAALRNLVNK
jgi:hypothetical protein